MSQTVERSTLDLRYEGHRVRDDAAEARLRASIAERGIQEPLEGVRLNAASVVNSPLLPYLQLVASCIERRKIGRDELVQALLRTLRQRSLSAGPRTTYVLAYLNRHPPEEQWHE